MPKKKRIYRVSIKANSELDFKLTFSPPFGPPEVRNYNFEIPISLEGYGKIEGLKRVVKCIGENEPKFLISPTTIDFPKKIITSGDKSVPDSREIILSNLSHEPLTWRIDDSRLISEGRVFSIKPNYGYLEYGMKAYLKIYFDPHNQQDYEVSVPVMIDDKKKP